MSPLIPMVVESDGRLGAFVRHLLPPAARADRLPRREVNDEVANVIVAQMLFLESEDPDKDIYLYVNSPGGSAKRAWRSTTRCSTSSRTWHELHRDRDVRGAMVLTAGAPGKRSPSRTRRS